MVQACIHIELSEGRWKTDVSQEYADASFQLLSMMPVDDTVIETVLISGCAIGECLSAIDTHRDIKKFEVIDHNESTATVQLETLEPAVLSAAVRVKTPIVYPAMIKQGALTTTVIGTHSAVSSLGDQLHADDLEFEITSIYSDYTGSQVLTDRQEEVLFAAIEHGYYKNPRECTLTEVADELGIAKSTCSAMLQRAEGAIIEYFCSQQQQTDLGTDGA